MANKIPEMIDEAIEGAIGQLNRLDKGTPEYNQMVTNIAKLNEQRLKEAELDAAAISKANDRTTVKRETFAEGVLFYDCKYCRIAIQLQQLILKRRFIYEMSRMRREIGKRRVVLLVLWA